ncbi:MAG: alpha-glucosidase C-terminal domain-containing protein [Balneolales bacterium]|nr:alpha-glucosidase C-terminal domain-containing protein [Balneolales bacterium]
MHYFSEISRKRAKIKIRSEVEAALKGLKKTHKDAFLQRYDSSFEDLASLLHSLYADQYDYFDVLRSLCVQLAGSWKSRAEWLKKQDGSRIENSSWYQDSGMVGAVCYVDLFAGDLKGIEQQIPYFKELGIRYLHLMPLFDSPKEENDGGYAVSSYRKVKEGLGTMKGLSALAKKLQADGISLVLDFINNHTSDEHEWAVKAKNGDPEFQQYYYMFDDRTIPDQFEPYLREIFPESRRGCFTYNEDAAKWVWTSFHSYQWDLNYRNPEVLAAMAGEMLFLANQGVEFLRLDAVPFTWKEAGTNCENLPQAHAIIKVLNVCARLAAPSLMFKSEAIVHPDDVSKYVHPAKCQVSYNPTLMALLWEALATRSSRLLTESLHHRFRIHPDTSWINYVRSHDDIGWTFSDDDAANLGINGYDHRHFLNQFYSGRFTGSFANGMPFQYNPSNGDMRICGTTASLAGIEKGIQSGDSDFVADGVRRVLLIYGICMSVGGIPLIYLGDEIASLNDYGFSEDSNKKGDSRWVHRVAADQDLMKLVFEAKPDYKPNNLREEAALGLWNGLRKMIAIRKKTNCFSKNEIYIPPHSWSSLLVFVKDSGNEKVVVVANFSEKEHLISLEDIKAANAGTFTDLLSGNTFAFDTKHTFPGYGLMWCKLQS